ncbi:M23 family metallopeptidase [Kribbella sp. NBC_01245]|uniref:M23 family metallopeptidase n=1 Tax=Kribbella sp. NBC_01245 TaxID=2903578 RepID=UPI002E2D408A|nr:M23 family metallopeptidase [Kribbella sp. NBC_01245]
MTAALAAAAGAVGFSHSSLASPTQANSAVNIAALNATMGKAELSAVTTARIERRQLATRDSSRLQLAQTASVKKQAAADRTAKARAAKLDAYRKVTQVRATALARAKAAAEKAELLKLQSATRAEMMLTGYRITATFGQGGTRWARNHTGTDFAADLGTRIGAVMKGEVIQAEFSGPYGRQVKVRHTDGTVTSYSHMNSFSVSVGDLVYAGDKLGEVGSSGNSTGPHLHFEVLPDGETAINPMPWLRDHGLHP